jgi:hypothetical protein
MPIKYYFKTGALIALVFLILSIACINFIDKSLALYVHAHGFDQWPLLFNITEDSILLLIIFSLIMVCIFPTDKFLWKRILFVLYAVAAFYLAIWIRRELGIVCARSWPNVWAGSGVYGGLIVDGQFGFHFFQTTTWKGSFPSGHCVETAYICCTMYLVYNRFKYLWSIPVVAMVLGQVLQYFHFLGDCFAGIALGVLVSYFGFALYSWLITFKQ